MLDFVLFYKNPFLQHTTLSVTLAPFSCDSRRFALPGRPSLFKPPQIPLPLPGTTTLNPYGTLTPTKLSLSLTMNKPTSPPSFVTTETPPPAANDPVLVPSLKNSSEFAFNDENEKPPVSSRFRKAVRSSPGGWKMNALRVAVTAKQALKRYVPI